MKIGMLWFDNDPKAELTSKIARAASYYRDKYGATPTLCFVHPSMVGDSGANSSANSAANSGGNSNGNGSGKSAAKAKQGLITAGVEVKTTPSVLPNHFWIGVNGANTNGAPLAK